MFSSDKKARSSRGAPYFCEWLLLLLPLLFTELYKIGRTTDDENSQESNQFRVSFWTPELTPQKKLSTLGDRVSMKRRVLSSGTMLWRLRLHIIPVIYVPFSPKRNSSANYWRSATLLELFTCNESMNPIFTSTQRLNLVSKRKQRDTTIAPRLQVLHICPSLELKLLVSRVKDNILEFMREINRQSSAQRRRLARSIK